MLFNSIPFLFFFGFVYFLYWNIPYKYRREFLILAGAIFYGYSSIPFLLHFLIVIVLNYYFYTQINRGNAKLYVRVAVVGNILNLAFFKYFYFFTTMFGTVFNSSVLLNAESFIRISLPLAISFYSFQMIALAVDSYRKPETELISFKNYLLSVMFFPILIAGPIMRKNDFLPNLDRKYPEKDQIYRASYLMISGIIKKIFIADPMASIIAPIYSSPNEYTALSIFLSGVFFTLQVYADFSGLTDMARSVALFLGFELPENFFAPLFALSGKELWRRWHATFSSWLRDYLYIGLGGSRYGELRTYLNLIITMILGGFWHGADYPYLAWGAYWGILLALERLVEDKYKVSLTPKKNIVLIVLKNLIVFLLFAFGAILFRANNYQSMVDMVVGMFRNHPDYLQNLLVQNNGQWLISSMQIVTGEQVFKMNTYTNYETPFYMYIMFLFFHFVQYKPEFLQRFRKYDFIIILLLGIITVFLLTTLSQDGETFIYYRF